MKILQLTKLWIKICQSYFSQKTKRFYPLFNTFKKPFHTGRMCLETAQTWYSKSAQTEKQWLLANKTTFSVLERRQWITFWINVTKLLNTVYHVHHMTKAWAKGMAMPRFRFAPVSSTSHSCDSSSCSLKCSGRKWLCFYHLFHFGNVLPVQPLQEITEK